MTKYWFVKYGAGASIDQEAEDRRRRVGQALRTYTARKQAKAHKAGRS
jgi:hypothetical protein